LISILFKFHKNSWEPKFKMIWNNKINKSEQILINKN
jgi:hypothetical protein